MGKGIWSKMNSMFSTGDQSGKGDESGDRYKGDPSAASLRFAVYMPGSYDEAARSADAMKNGSGVVINGESLDSAAYQRVLDFLDGASYVLGGTGRRVSDTVQVYVPTSIEIVDDSVSFYGNLNTGKRRTDV